jgi:propionyl-CoA carboxylase alpha chain
VYSDADADSLHVAACDRAVHLPGNSPAETYLRIDLLLDAAARGGADAVHPGYGFLAEADSFASAVVAAGLTWVGPPAEAIAAMGSKIAAKALMQASGVPTLPEGPDAGFPLLVKASAGGGGRGMRIVRDAAELDAAMESASREAASAFGDGEVFCERYVERGRHIEIQVFADTHGTAVALHERECSIQRRHQKIIEEAPSPAVDDVLREAMGRAAVDAAKAVGYVGAGTVEFLLDESGEFFFLEMNTRLQVEHPVTEAITGLDLVELQLRVAEGEPLPDEALDPPILGHAIEARLTAEDPAADYRPAVGTLVRFDVPGDVRVDTGVSKGSAVSPFYDSMIAKVVAHGPTRAAAARTLRKALADARVAGVTTNRDQLVNILGDPDFLAGRLHTGFLDEDRRDAARTGAVEVACAAVWYAADTVAPQMLGIAPGWRNNRAVARTRNVRIGGDEIVLSEASIAASLAAPVTIAADGLVTVPLEAGGVRVDHTVTIDGAWHHVHGPDGHVSIELLPRHPEPQAVLRRGSLVATMPGVIRRVLVAVGDAVVAGQPLVVLEAMKMEHQIGAPAGGTVTEVRVAEGEQVEAGSPLLAVE